MTQPPLKSAIKIEESRDAYPKYFPVGLLQVAFILSPFTLLTNALTGVDKIGGKAPLIWDYSVTFFQSFFVYLLTFLVQSGKSLSSERKARAHFRSLVISIIVISLLSLGSWYNLSQSG